MNIVPIGFLLLKQSHDTSFSHRDKITGLLPVGGRKDKSIAILEADVNVASLHGNDVSHGNHTKVPSPTTAMKRRNPGAATALHCNAGTFRKSLLLLGQHLLRSLVFFANSLSYPVSGWEELK